MAVEFFIPKLGQTVEEVTLVSWLVEDGAKVSQGQEVMEVETDKAVVEIPSPEGVSPDAPTLSEVVLRAILRGPDATATIVPSQCRKSGCFYGAKYVPQVCHRGCLVCSVCCRAVAGVLRGNNARVLQGGAHPAPQSFRRGLHASAAGGLGVAQGLYRPSDRDAGIDLRLARGFAAARRWRSSPREWLRPTSSARRFGSASGHGSVRRPGSGSNRAPRPARSHATRSTCSTSSRRSACSGPARWRTQCR